MIDVVYHGDPALHDVTRMNHDQMLDLLRQNWPIRVHSRNCIDTDKVCEFERHGPSEIWRFYQRMTGLNQPIIVYLSSDVWFGPGAAQAVLAEVGGVINGDTDMIFMGSDFQTGYGEQHYRCSIDKHRRLGEHVIIARKNAVNSEDEAMQYLRSHKQFKDAARSWPAVIRNIDRAVSVQCQTYIVLRTNQEITNWRAAWDYMRTVDHSDEALTWWLMNRPSDQRM